jgi:hypothetical protein
MNGIRFKITKRRKYTVTQIANNNEVLHASQPVKTFGAALNNVAATIEGVYELSGLDHLIETIKIENGKVYANRLEVTIQYAEE